VKNSQPKTPMGWIRGLLGGTNLSPKGEGEQLAFTTDAFDSHVVFREFS